MDQLFLKVFFYLSANQKLLCHMVAMLDVGSQWYKKSIEQPIDHSCQVQFQTALLCLKNFPPIFLLFKNYYVKGNHVGSWITKVSKIALMTTHRWFLQCSISNISVVSEDFFFHKYLLIRINYLWGYFFIYLFCKNIHSQKYYLYNKSLSPVFFHHSTSIIQYRLYYISG